MGEYVYLLRCSNVKGTNILYIGYSQNIEKRMLEHQYSQRGFTGVYPFKSLKRIFSLKLFGHLFELYLKNHRNLAKYLEKYGLDFSKDNGRAAIQNKKLIREFEKLYNLHIKEEKEQLKQIKWRVFHEQ